MHQDLEAWLDLVWGQKDSLIAASTARGVVKGRGAVLGEDNPAIWRIYDLYNGSDESSRQGLVRAHLEKFLQDLIALEIEIKTAPVVQIGKEFIPLNPGGLHAIRTTGSCKDRGEKRTINERQIANSFLHYMRGNAGSVHRIYVNAKAPYRAEVFASILMKGQAWKVPDLYEAKVSGPDDDGRADSIVIYTTTPTARDAIIDGMRPYNTANQGHFGAALPRLTVPVEGMVGVGTADEPPSYQIVRSGGQYYQRYKQQSFGFYRASLIFMALDRTKFARPGQSDSERCAAFKRRTAKYFRAAGIDPDRPASQGAVATMLSWSDLEARIAKVPE